MASTVTLHEWEEAFGHPQGCTACLDSFPGHAGLRARTLHAPAEPSPAPFLSPEHALCFHTCPEAHLRGLGPQATANVPSSGSSGKLGKPRLPHPEHRSADHVPLLLLTCGVDHCSSVFFLIPNWYLCFVFIFLGFFWQC